MMMQEQNNNTFTKERSDVERYLLRIIQRYFDTENNYSKASIESIIVESLTRFKRFCKNKGKKFLFSFNKQTGHIVIDIGSFGGEHAFAKNTAFNTDFGDQIDTICEGDDPRLSDARPTTEHEHECIDITGLDEALKQIDIPNYVHNHKNQSLLSILDYTGTALEIDLVVLEHIRSHLPMYQTNAATISANLTAFHNQQVDGLNSSVATLNDLVAHVASNIMLGAEWIQSIRNSIRDGVQEVQDYALRRFASLITQDQQQLLQEGTAKAYQLESTGSFDIQATVSGIKNITNNGQPFVVYNITSDTATLSVTDADCLVNLYFQYEDDDGNTVRAPLPMIFQDKVGSNVIIQCGVQGNVAQYQTLISAAFSGQGVYDENYHDGKLFILRTKGKPQGFYDAIGEANEKRYSFIDYDPNSAIQQTMLQSISASDSFHVGAFYDIELEQYIYADQRPCKFTATENGQRGVVYYKDGKLYSGMNIDAHEQLFDMPMLNLEDYYKSPRIYYEVYRKGA